MEADWKIKIIHMLWRGRYQGRRKFATRKMQKKRTDWLGTEILFGATGGRDKLELGIVEGNAWGEPQAMGRRDGLLDGALQLDKLLRQSSETRNQSSEIWEREEKLIRTWGCRETTGIGVNKWWGNEERGETETQGRVCVWDGNYKLTTCMSQYIAIW